MGMIFAAIFYWLAEEHASEPVLGAAKPAKAKLFPTRTLWIFFLLMSLIFSFRDFAGSGMASLGSLFLQNAHGLDPKKTGFILSGIYLASAVSNPVFGHLSDGGRMRWAVSLLLIAAAMVALFPRVPKEWMFATLSAYGFFFLASYPVLEAALMESVPDAVRGRVFGLFITFGGLIGNVAHWGVGDFVKNLGARAATPEAYYRDVCISRRARSLSLLGLPFMRLIRSREGLEHSAPAEAIPHRQTNTRDQMNLPNYFIADLPPEAVLTPALIEEACQTLKRNREQYLANRATPALIRVLSDDGGKLAPARLPVPQTRARARPARHRFFRRHARQRPRRLFPAGHGGKSPRAARAGPRPRATPRRTQRHQRRTRRAPQRPGRTRRNSSCTSPAVRCPCRCS